MKEGSIFAAAADSRLIGFIAPTDEEFIVVDADDDRLPPFDQIVVLIKACCKNQRTRLELAPQIGGNCRRCGLRFCTASQRSFLACCGFEQALKCSNYCWRSGRQREPSLRVDSGFGQSGRGASTSMWRRNVQDVAAVFLLIFITQLY